MRVVCALALLAAVSAQFAPQQGVLMTIGQDVDSIDMYNRSVGIVPGGVVGYTGVNDLAGFDFDANWGAGRNNFAELSRNYPQSTLILGIAMNGLLGAINAGQLDGQIGHIIDVSMSYNRPVYLRWGYEVDGPWNAHDPQQFIQSWLRLFNMVRARGARNIALVWQVASYCGGTYNGLPITAWYPGDQYVDWIGLSYFTPYDCNFQQVNMVGDFARQRNKPLFISESAPQRFDIDRLTYSPNPGNNDAQPVTAQQIWNDWFVNYFNFIRQYDVKAITYINAYWDRQPMWGPPYNEGYWGDSQVQDNQLIFSNWINEVNNTNWLHAAPDLFQRLGYFG